MSPCFAGSWGCPGVATHIGAVARRPRKARVENRACFTAELQAGYFSASCFLQAPPHVHQKLVSCQPPGREPPVWPQAQAASFRAAVLKRAQPAGRPARHSALAAWPAGGAYGAQGVKTRYCMNYKAQVHNYCWGRRHLHPYYSKTAPYLTVWDRSVQSPHRRPVGQQPEGDSMWWRRQPSPQSSPNWNIGLLHIQQGIRRSLTEPTDYHISTRRHGSQIQDVRQGLLLAAKPWGRIFLDQSNCRRDLDDDRRGFGHFPSIAARSGL